MTLGSIYIIITINKQKIKRQNYYHRRQGHPCPHQPQIEEIGVKAWEMIVKSPTDLLVVDLTYSSYLEDK
jgi:hypothetical protein